MSVDLINKRFGRLVVIKQAYDIGEKQTRWLCTCDCGKEKIVRGSSLRSCRTQSCGCLNVEKTKQRFTKHGHNKKGKTTKTYKSWECMIRRCTNPNYSYYSNYGGRGIKVCQRWRQFANFLEDMGEVSEGYQIDRIDNNGNYCKLNCRWATKRQQMRNTRKNHLITHNGKTQCIATWAEEFEINQCVLGRRISRGWSVKKALETPVRYCKRRGV